MKLLYLVKKNETKSWGMYYFRVKFVVNKYHYYIDYTFQVPNFKLTLKEASKSCNV